MTLKSTCTNPSLRNGLHSISFHFSLPPAKSCQSLSYKGCNETLSELDLSKGSTSVTSFQSKHKNTTFKRCVPRNFVQHLGRSHLHLMTITQLKKYSRIIPHKVTFSDQWKSMANKMFESRS